MCGGGVAPFWVPALFPLRFVVCCVVESVSGSREHPSWSEQQVALRSQIGDQQAGASDQAARTGNPEQDRARRGGSAKQPSQ